MIRFIFFMFLITAITVTAQIVKPVNPNIIMEVLSESKNIDDEDQYIQVQISCQTFDVVNTIFLSFENTPARWTVVSAQLNDELLWLLKAGTKTTHDKVLAWDFDESMRELKLFPSNWQVPYVLDLQLQMNMNDRGKIQTQYQDKIIVEADLITGDFSASPTGRGDIITLR